MNAALIIVGILIVGGMFFVSTYYAQQVQQLKLAGVVCDSPIGGIGSILSQDIAQRCSIISTANTVINFSPIGYGIGILLIIAGLVIGGGSSKRESHREADEEEPDDTEKETPKKGKGVKFCPECGNKIKVGEKFCGSCGAKVK